MVLYGITLIPLTEYLRAEDPELVAPLYADNPAFDGLEFQSARLLTLFLEWGASQGYLPDPANLLFICDSPA